MEFRSLKLCDSSIRYWRNLQLAVKLLSCRLMSLWLVRKLWRNPDSLKWLEAIYRLKCFKWLEAIKHTQCFDDKIEILLICKNSFTPIGCKFVLRIKTIKHEIVFTHKARLVAKGYKQIHGMDCVGTSCIIVMLKSIIQAMIAYRYI